MSGDTAAEPDETFTEIVLRESDFPSGWTSSPPAESKDDESDREVAACLGIEYSPDRSKAHSPQFRNGDVTRATSIAELAPSAEVAAAEFAAINGPNANRCIKQQFDKELREGAGAASFAPADVRPLPFPKVGDESLALRLTTAVTPPGQPRVPIYLDVVIVRKGQVELTLTFLHARVPFSGDRAVDITQKLVARA